MINCPKKSKRGITLIEVLLYTALITIFITLAMPLFIDINIWHGRQSALSNTANEFLFLNQYVSGLIENSDHVVAPAMNQSSDFLVVNTRSGDEVILGADSAGKMYVNVENEEKIFITSTTTRADHIQFSRSFVGNAGNLEKIEFSVNLNGLHFGTTSLIIPND